MSSLTHNRQRAFRPVAEQFSELLRRYPRVDHDEIEAMIAIYPELTILEVGLLSADDFIGESFHDFRRAHHDRLKSSWRHQALFAIVMVASIALPVALLWGLMA